MRARSSGLRRALERAIECVSSRRRAGLAARGCAWRASRTATPPKACAELRLEVSRNEVPPAPSGLHYFFELVGCRCVDGSAGELGEVTEVVESSGGLLLQVAHADGRSLLVPYVEEFLTCVDIVGRRIELKLPRGLVEACEFKS